jgi:hypothetical protein
VRTVPITLPAWFTIAQRLVIKAGVAIAGASIAGVFALILVKAVVYRDFHACSCGMVWPMVWMKAGFAQSNVTARTEEKRAPASPARRSRFDGD